MPRPTTKQSLLEAAEKGFKELFGFAEAMSEEERCAEFLFEDRDRNISESADIFSPCGKYKVLRGTGENRRFQYV